MARKPTLQIPTMTDEQRGFVDEAPRGTPRRPEAPEGAPRRPEAPQGTPGHPEAPRGTSKGLIQRRSGALTKKINIGFTQRTGEALEAVCKRRGWRMNVFVDELVWRRLVELGEVEDGQD